MKTKFDIGDDTYIHGNIKSIAINEKGEIYYRVAIRSDGFLEILTFDEDEIEKASQDNVDTEKTCIRCKYKLNLTHDISSPCYTCYRNPDKGRLPDNWIEDKE